MLFVINNIILNYYDKSLIKMLIYSIISTKVSFRKKGLSMSAEMRKVDPEKAAELVKSSACVFMGTSQGGGTLIYISPAKEIDLEKMKVKCECEK